MKGRGLVLLAGLSLAACSSEENPTNSASATSGSSTSSSASSSGSGGSGSGAGGATGSGGGMSTLTCARLPLSANLVGDNVTTEAWLRFDSLGSDPATCEVYGGPLTGSENVLQFRYYPPPDNEMYIIPLFGQYTMNSHGTPEGGSSNGLYGFPENTDITLDFLDNEQGLAAGSFHVVLRFSTGYEGVTVSEATYQSSGDDLPP